MKKKILLLLFVLLSVLQIEAQQTLALANDGSISTSGSGRAPQGSRLCARSVYLITQSEMQANGFFSGQLISAIGFNYAVAQSIPTTSDSFALYLQNSSDVSYSKATDWDSAITGMTLVRNTNITIPASTGIFTIPFSGGNNYFVYSGGSVYVAFDYQNFSGQISSSNRAYCTTVVPASIKTYVSSTVVGPILSNSSFRPETYFTKGCSTLIPFFNSVSPITAGASLSPLPTTSNNGIQGTWSPALNNLATTTYTFTPFNSYVDGQCVASTTMTITVNQILTPPGNALNFDGTNDYVSFNAATNTATNFTSASTFTIECWVNSSSTAQSAFIAHRPSGGSTAGYALFTNYGPTGTVGFETNGGGLVATRKIELGKWNHIALVYNAGTATFYINGIASGTTSNLLISATTQPLLLGLMPVTSNYGFNGSMDEVRIWNTARTASQIQSNMLTAVSVPSAGLLAYYNFDTGSAGATNTGVTTLVDQSGNGNTGALNNFGLSNTTPSTSNWVESYAMVVPTATAATNINSTGFTANWTAPTVGTVDNLYIVSVSASSNFDPPATNYQISPSVTSFDITGLNPGTTYYYRVRADKSSVTTQGGYSATMSACTSSTVGAASSSPFLCVNTVLIAITHATTGATGIGTATGLPTGVTAAWANNTITITGTPTVAGTFTYSIPLVVGCGNAVNATGTITVNTTAVPYTLGQSFCEGATVFNLYSIGTDVKWYSVPTGGTSLSPATVLVGGNYYGSQTLNGCESDRIGTTITINPNVTPTFTQVAALPEGSNIDPLPTISTNGIAGTWSPTLNNTATTTYTFTPTAGQCATATTMTISITIQQYTAIPDSNFEQALINLGYDTVLDGKVPTANISGVTSLNVSWNNISNLTGIRAFTSLSYFRCRGNYLTSLDLSGLQNLDYVDCALNYLSSLNVSGLQSMTTLEADNNNVLQSIDLTGLTNLNFLKIQGNGMTSLDVSGLTNLQFLHAYNNQLSCIKVSNVAAANSNPNWYKDTTAGYSTNCSLVIPMSKIKANQCGTTLASLNANINADYYAGYEQYRFEVTNGTTVNTVDVNKYNFSLTQTPGITYNTTYGVRVKVKMGGVWGEYGPSCNLTTPALTVNVVPTTTIMPAFCGTTLASLDTKIGAVLIYGATKGRFEVTKAGSAPVVYEVAAYNFKLSQTGVVVAYNTTYSIRVAAFVNGVWGNYGAACTVTTPAAPGGRMKAKSFEVVAYPNPFDTAFNLSLETPSTEVVTIAVYDMMGKLVENRFLNTSEIENVTLGQNYATGIYNVIISQGENSKTVRLIKK